jgi:hypothetical protein
MCAFKKIFSAAIKACLNLATFENRRATAAVNEEIIRSLTQRAEGPGVYPAKGGALE